MTKKSLTASILIIIAVLVFPAAALGVEEPPATDVSGSSADGSSGGGETAAGGAGQAPALDDGGKTDSRAAGTTDPVGGNLVITADIPTGSDVTTDASTKDATDTASSLAGSASGGGVETAEAGNPGTSIAIPPDSLDIDNNGDGKAELAVFYDYGGANTGLFLFDPVGSGYGTPRPVWSSGPGNWEWWRSKLTAGDTNGDGKSELAAFYDYGGGNTGLFIFSPSGSGYSAPQRVWLSGPGNWEWPFTKVIAIDRNGDSRCEFAALYNYSGGTAGLFIFDPVSGYTPQQVWYSGPGNWEWLGTKLVAFDRNGDGSSEIAAFYNYGAASAGLFIFDPAAGYVPQRVWFTGPGNWNWWRTKLTATDRNGDGITEIAALYDYDYATAALFLFDPASGYTPQQAWASGFGNWGWGVSMMTAADNDNDGKSELVILYDYGRGNTGLWLFDTSGSGFSAPSRYWLSGGGNWGWNRTKQINAECFEARPTLSLETLRYMADWLNAQVGKPYIWGAGHPPDPNLEGYDCSGLVSSVLQLVGIPISGTTYDIIYQVRVISEIAARQSPLVIVFSGDLSHMGIGILGQWWEATPPVVLGPAHASNYWDIYAIPAIVSSGLVGAGPWRRRSLIKLLVAFRRRRRNLPDDG